MKYLMPNIHEILKPMGIKGIHPAAELFPMMDQDAFTALCESIQEFGLEQEVVLTHDGYLIDGRNRMMACYLTGHELVHIKLNEAYSGDYIDYSLRVNLHRRHLTASQKSTLAVEVEKLYAEEAKEKERLRKISLEKPKDEKGMFKKEESTLTVQKVAQSVNEEKRSREKAAEVIGVNHAYVSDAKRIQKEAPEAFDAMKQGNLSIPEAKRYVKDVVEPSKKENEGQLEIDREKQLEEWRIQEEKRKEDEAEQKRKEREEAKKEEKRKEDAEKRRLNPPPKTFNETTDSIEWAKYTWNPITGCKFNCSFCYAKDLSDRYKMQKDFNEPVFHEDRIDAPRCTKKKENWPNNVFVCSMSDLMGDWIPAEWIERVIESMENNMQWNFLLLTKNPKRYLEFIDRMPVNVTLGATATNQAQYNRLYEAFSQINTDHLKFVSFEPLNERIECTDPMPFDWSIIGGRSATIGSPAFQPEWEWVDHIYMQSRKNNVKIYFKPNLAVRPKETPFEE